MYSASMVDRAVRAGSLDKQVIGYPVYMMIHPAYDFTIIGSATAPSGFQFPAKSELTQYWKHLA